MYRFLAKNVASKAPRVAAPVKTGPEIAVAVCLGSLRRAILLVVPAVLIAQTTSLDKELAMPAMTAPPVIVVVPAAGKLLVTLLATKDVPPGTSVLPVVTKGRERSILPSVITSASGPYPLAIVPVGSDIIAYITPPRGVMYKLRSASIVTGSRYSGETLTLYGTFSGRQTLVYVGSSLVPVRPTIIQDHIELPLKATGATTTVTVYQAGGYCDSVVVRLSRVDGLR